MVSLRIFGLLICLIGCHGYLDWELVHSGNHSLAPLPRRDAGLGYYIAGKSLVLFGGRTILNKANIILGDIWIYDLEIGYWREITPKSADRPPARFSFVSGVHGDYFYISTGEGKNRLFFNDIWRFHIRNEVWEELPPQVRPSYIQASDWSAASHKIVRPAIRYGAAGGIFHNSTRFYITHGFAGYRFSDTFSYSVTERAWTLAYKEISSYRPLEPHARCLHAGTMVSEDELVIFGGCLTGGESGGPCPSGDSWLFDGKLKRWTEMPGCASPRNYASMAALPIKDGQRRIVLYGGIENSKQVITTVESPADQVGLLNPDLFSWQLKKTHGNIPSKRASAAMTTGPDGVFMFGGYDIKKKYSLNDLYHLRGDAFSADQAPKEAECEPTFFNLVALHGILMVIGWGFFLQWGAFIARYLRNKDPLWFNLHRLFQVFGLIIAIGGFIAGVLSVQYDHFEFAHGIIGLVVMVLGIQQPINAVCRPHISKLPNATKSFQRIVWEVFHKWTGRAALILALCNISLGVFFGLSSQVLWVLWFVYVGLLLFFYLMAELGRYCKRSTVRTPSPKKYTVTHRNQAMDSGISNPVYTD